MVAQPSREVNPRLQGVVAVRASSHRSPIGTDRASRLIVSVLVNCARFRRVPWPLQSLAKVVRAGGDSFLTASGRRPGRHLDSACQVVEDAREGELLIAKRDLQASLEFQMQAQRASNNTGQSPSKPSSKKPRRPVTPEDTDLNILSWLSYLPEHERTLLLAEVSPLIAAADGTAVVKLLHEWRATALIYADKALFEKLSSPLPEDFQL